jgi:hypothetical protein
MAETFKMRNATLSTVNANVYVCPANTTAIVFMGQVANIDTANSADMSIWAYDSVGSVAAKALVRTVPVPADAATTFLTGKLVLEANDYIFGLASANNHLDVTVSILEIT